MERIFGHLCRAQGQPGGNQDQHHINGRHVLRDQWLLPTRAKEAIDLARMTFADGGVAQRQGIAQHFLRRNLLEGEHGMAGRHRHHQFILPSRSDHDAIACIFGPRKPGVVQVVVQSLVQFLDGAGQKRLVDVQPLGNAGEVEFFGDGQKTSEVTQFHESMSL
ncbi:hypothetical protein ALDI51_28920 [Alicycliphilus denitrificans]|nr:hypothetical protein ALDI51_28920 [Alicycliphilus denitrificans]